MAAQKLMGHHDGPLDWHPPVYSQGNAPEPAPRIPGLPAATERLAEAPAPLPPRAPLTWLEQHLRSEIERSQAAAAAAVPTAPERGGPDYRIAPRAAQPAGLDQHRMMERMQSQANDDARRIARQRGDNR